jgi:D-aminopeptidase
MHGLTKRWPSGENRAVLVALSADMEGVSQLRDPREILAGSREYWETGKPRMEADVAAACEGLIAGGASEVVVLDNHASGNPRNVSAESLPPGARLEEWGVFELAGKGVAACLHLGYHARGGVDGFLSHTYVPGLRLRVGEELISESHGRAWAAGVPLLGIVGNDAHERTLGSLEGTPYLVVQRSQGRAAMQPVFERSWVGLDAIAAFAAECVGLAGSLSAPAPPERARFAASMPNGAEVAEEMSAGGWTRTGELVYSLELASWRDAQAPLAVAMAAAFAPWTANWSNDLLTREAAQTDPAKAERLAEDIVAWANETQPEWYGDLAPGGAAPGIH